MKLIDVEYALQQIEIGEFEHRGIFESDSSHIKDFLNALPAVDAVEVVHGRFILDSGKDVIRCSACGFESSSTIPYICDGERWVPFYERKYCGNCGAKMDGGN